MKLRRKNALKKGAAMRSDEDELGSYTGVNAREKDEKPIQDADDL